MKDKYKKFEKCNLPAPFWNEDRKVLEYVYYEDGEVQVCDSLERAIEEVTYLGFYYSFNIRHKEIHFAEKGKETEEIVIGHVHEHTFEDVIRSLYHAPEYFSIPEEDEIYYSKQQLKYLRFLQKYLLFLGVKDQLEYSLDNKRYQNPIYEKYKRKGLYTVSNKAIDDFINHKRDYWVKEYYPEWSKEETYKPGERTALVRNEDGDIRLYVEITKRKIKDAKDYQEIIKDTELKDHEKVVIEYVKPIEIFKNNK